MRIFKENSYDIVRLYINQLGITIFSMFLYTAVAQVDDSDLFLTLRVLVSVFSTVFYLVLVYNVMWDIGAKDKIRIESDKMTPQPLKGAVMSLYANVPNFLLALVCVVLMSVYMLSDAGGAYSAFVIMFTVLRYHSSMYMGIIQGVTPAAPGADTNIVDLADCLMESALFLIIPLVSVALTHLSYYLGTKEIRIFGGRSSKTTK